MPIARKHCGRSTSLARPHAIHSSGFLKNTWYVAARSSDIGPSRAARRILDEAIVFCRDPDAAPHALENACPHRKLPLLKGTLRGETFECGYHGLIFDGTGRRVAAPT
ncbi:Rieske 2Fe-2S domain-containing protein [Ovoidimarina sediminis]|uniref:Rieske 2Fe-2S domain-containing protein n=1 Tax=Ovoidimarina sediminis TaxID=3079856 RepID=UPI003977D20B